MSITTAIAARGWSPDKISEFDIDGLFPDLFLTSMTTKAGEVGGDVPSVRVPFVSADAAASIVSKGAEITPTNATPDEVVISTRKAAVLSRVSNELILGNPAAQMRLMNSLQRAVIAKANTEYVAALASASANFVQARALGTDLDVFSDAIADVAANGGEVSHLVMNAASWKTLAKIKSATGSRPSPSLARARPPVTASSAPSSACRWSCRRPQRRST